jgi:hypothetical protein
VVARPERGAGSVTKQIKDIRVIEHANEEKFEELQKGKE